MRILFGLAVCILGLALTGCAGSKKSEAVFQSYSGDTANSSASTASKTPIVQLAQGLTGKISAANANLKFVVVTFPIAQMASIDQRLNVYRDGLKVGELRVTGPQQDDSIVADITAGESQIGDEVRDR